MNKNLNITLKNISSEQGFAIPVAVGMGLIMILIATTMVVRSQGDKVTASAQKATNRALSAAETGITRYQSLINNNRVIAMYPRVGTPGWTTAINILGISNCASTTTGSTVVTNAATTDWRDVDPPDTATGHPGDPSKGQYRLVDYVYPAPGTTGTGQLTVEGRVNQVGSSSTATKGLGTATTRLQVNIPVNLGSLNTAVPGLWVKNSTITAMGNDKVNGNIVINSCPPVTSPTSTNLYDPSTQKVIANPVGFPDTPNLPPARANGTASYYTLTGSSAPWTNFPRGGDLAADDGYYHYLIDKLDNPTGSSNITIQSGKKVIFYVKGNITLSGGADINNTAGNTAAQLQIYGNTYTSASTTKYGCASGTTLGSGCPTLTAHFNGTGTMRAYLHAPDATGSVNGGGATSGNFKGSIWIKDWDSSSGNSKVKIDAEGNYSNILGAQNIPTPPLISPVTSWQRQEAP